MSCSISNEVRLTLEVLTGALSFMFIIIGMLYAVRGVFLCVFLMVAIEAAGQDQLRIASDLHALGRESDLHKIPVVLFFSSAECEYCELVRDEFFNHLSTDPAFMDRLLLLEIRIDGNQPLLNFNRQPTTHVGFAEQCVVELVPTIQFTDGVGELLVEDIVGLGTLAFYGAYLEQGIEQSLSALRLRD